MALSSFYLSFGICLLILTGHARLTSSSCPQPAPVDNADVSGPAEGGQGFQPGDTLTLKCRLGYILDESVYDYNYDYDSISVDSMTITCGQDDTWSGTFVACEAFTCHLPVAPPHGTLALTRPGQTTFHEGDRVHFQCDPGRDLIGRRSARCSSAAFGWTSRAPTCTKPVCTSLVELENGRVSGSSYEVGATLTFHCSDGYVLRGPASRTCLPNRRWGGDVAVCDNGESDCGNPGIPDGGSKRGTHYNVGNVVTFVCEPGFVLFGDARRRCLRNKRWMGQEVSCEAPYAYDSATDLGKRWRATADILAQETETSIMIKEKVRMEAESRTRHLSSTSRRRVSRPASADVVMKRSLIHGAPSRFSAPMAAREDVTPLVAAPKISYSGGLDVYFLFDVSGSIEPDDFEKEIDFAATLIQEWGVSDGDKGTKVGALIFNTSAHVVFHTTEKKSVSEAVSALREISTDVGGGTNMAAALRQLIYIMIPQTEAMFPERRSKIVIIIITDGLANTGGSPEALAHQLKDKDDYNAEIFCIGVSRETSRKELKKLASEKHNEHVFVTDQPNEFREVISRMRREHIDYSECGRAGDTDLSSDAKAVGGAQAKTGAWPWMAAIYYGKNDQTNINDKLQYYRQLKCGGTVIAPQWVLTAAHCTYTLENTAIRPTQLLTVMGTTKNRWASYGSDGQGISLPPSASPGEVQQIYRHPSFNHATMDGDLALLKLQIPVVFSPEIRPACLPTTDNKDALYKADQFGAVTGWGHPDPMTRTELLRGTKTVKHLRQIEIDVQPQATCARSLTNYTSVVTPNMFCAGDTSKSDIRQDSCHGDSGGPFVVSIKDQLTNQVNWTLTGIVSWGIGCGQDDHYGFYTRVDRYLDWIAKTTGSN